MAELSFVFYTWPDITALTIRLATQSVWSHVELGLPQHQQSWGSVRKHGVASFDWECRVKGAAKAMQVTVPATPFQEYAAKEFVYHQLGKPYDIWGALGLGLGRDWQDDQRWFCSELMAAALLKADYPKAKHSFGSSWRVTPGNLRKFLLKVPGHNIIHLKTK